jgi:signal transduction histidine kinase
VRPAASIEFAAAVAHELKTPVAAIRRAADALGSGESIDEPTQRRLVGVINDAAAQAERLLADLLTAGRLGAGRLPVEVRAVDVMPVVRASVETVAAAREGAAIDVAASGAVSTGALADPDRLRQALGNLLDNAVEHAPAGSPVLVRVASSADRVRIEVVDEGPGVPAEERERVFDPYVRLSERRAGTGLGLYLARELVRAMGGDITLDVARETGSRFTVELQRDNPERGTPA